MVLPALSWKRGRQYRVRIETDQGSGRRTSPRIRIRISFFDEKKLDKEPSHDMVCPIFTLLSPGRSGAWFVVGYGVRRSLTGECIADRIHRQGRSGADDDAKSGPRGDDGAWCVGEDIGRWDDRIT